MRISIVKPQRFSAREKYLILLSSTFPLFTCTTELLPTHLSSLRLSAPWNTPWETLCRLIVGFVHKSN